MRQSFGEELLTGWFLAFLVGASLAIAVPAGLRSRRSSPFPSAQLFKKRMSMMAPRSRGGRWVVLPEGASAVQVRHMERVAKRRRTRIMVLLVLVALGTGIWAVAGSGAAISVHLAVDLVALSYGAVVYEAGRRRSERTRKVRTLARQPLSAPSASWPPAIEVKDDRDPLFVDEPIAL